jgi:iron complex transport system ATP-binding protein
MTFQVQNGCFHYSGGKEILSDVNICVRDNQILTILGSNGVGKTTLLKCMLGLLKWTAGETRIDGRPIAGMKHQEFWKKIGYVPQAKLSAFAYTVEEMVLLGRNAHLKMGGLPRAEDVKIMEESLSAIGVRYLRHKLCSRISGGELQMVLIARALAAKPSLLILDEPESNLDFRNQIIVLDAVRRLSREKQISSIVNTHYPEHALSISDLTLLLCGDGTSVCGDSASIITEPYLRKAFGVHVKICDIPVEQSSYTCVLPLSLA